ncbi:hypothetical protein [Rathayibacter tritici]|uniref:hypothetical protein n=1 Tax=Rathayibacter tritici TaxID=33888 RepID=UPI000ACA8EC3|nr:hypothetical protein [Rathayibacter tritici]
MLQTTAGLTMLVFGRHVEVLAIVSPLRFLGAAVLLHPGFYGPGICSRTNACLSANAQ